MNPEAHRRIGEIIDKVMHPSSEYMKKIMEILGRHKKNTGECYREKVKKNHSYDYNMKSIEKLFQVVPKTEMIFTSMH